MMKTLRAYILSQMLFIYLEKAFYLTKFTDTYDADMRNNYLL